MVEDGSLALRWRAGTHAPFLCTHSLPERYIFTSSFHQRATAPLDLLCRFLVQTPECISILSFLRLSRSFFNLRNACWSVIYIYTYMFVCMYSYTHSQGMHSCKESNITKKLRLSSYRYYYKNVVTKQQLWKPTIWSIMEILFVDLCNMVDRKELCCSFFHTIHVTLCYIL